jgi:hypothetical protein
VDLVEQTHCTSLPCHEKRRRHSRAPPASFVAREISRFFANGQLENLGREDLEAAAEVQNDYRAWFEKGVNAFAAKASKAA